jgi:tRNA dimethylallyltransferase
MDIGTAKPTIKEQQNIKHHLLDIIDPNKYYSVVEFKTKCEKIIKDIQNRGKIPFLVGGSGLYIDSVLYDYKFRSANTNIDTSKMTKAEILTKAKQLYPVELAKIDQKNTRRIEQLLQFGPVKTNDRNIIKIECKILGTGKNKLIIKQNIEMRTKQMLNNGIIQETEKIINKFGRDCPGLNTIGYKQCVEYIDGKLAKNELATAINKATFDLAKRQMTWFKRNTAIHWIDSAIEADHITANYIT